MSNLRTSVTREHKRFAQRTDKTPRMASGRTDEKTRERIARPIGATPRRAQDWR